MMEYILIPKRLDNKNINELIKLVLSQTTSGFRKLKLDLSETTFISTFAMSLFILMCDQVVYEKKVTIHFKLSNSNRLHGCLHIATRLGFFDALPSISSFYPYKPKQKYKGSNTAILEITKIDKNSLLVDIINLSREAIIKNTNYEGAQILDICKMMSELIQNILEHSASTKPGIVLIQSYPTQQYTQLVIADSGVGIPRTIKSNTEYNKLNDAECIQKSLQYGVTRYEESEERGEGLSECVQLADKHNAKLFIRSNTGSIHYDKNKNICLEDGLCKLNGTQIGIKFPSI